MDAVISTLSAATPTLSTFTAYLSYYAWICLASIFLPSTIVKGHPKPKRGEQLTYSINGFTLTVVTLLLVVLLGGVFPSLKQLQLFPVITLAK